MANSSDDSDRKDSSLEEVDQVSAAYEDINKRLEGLKKGEDLVKEKEDDKDDEDEEEEEDDDKEDETEDEDPLDSEDDDKEDDKDDEEVEEEVEEKEEENEDEEEEPPKSSFKDDVEDGSQQSQEVEKETDAKSQSGEEKEDNLDDLASEESPALDEPPQRPTRRFDIEESDMDIPNLKRSSAENFGPVSSPYKDEPLITQKNPFTSSYASAPRNRGGNKIHLLILILIGLAVIGGTVYLLKNQFDETSPTPSPTSTPEVSPTPLPTPSFDRSKYKIRVLNGTTKTGLAGTVSAKLKDLGYQVDRTGNAPKQNYTTTEVRVKTSATGLSEQLIKDLPSEFSGASASGELKDSDSADGEVILGAK